MLTLKQLAAGAFAASSLVALATAPITAQAGAPPPLPDLTGTWTGRVVCDEYEISGVGEPGRNFNSIYEGTLEISQEGKTLIAYADVAGLPNDDFCGQVIPLQNRPEDRGVAALSRSSNQKKKFWSVFLDEVRLFDENNRGESGVISGKGPFTKYVDDPYGEGIVSECRWVFSRTDETDPNVLVNNCPVPIP